MSDDQTVSLRCLSACSLAELCVKSSFHMFLRASDLSSKIFATLHDAHKDERLALCAATLFFILSRDGMSLDVDKNAVELLCKLLGIVTPLHSNKEKEEYAQLQQRLNGICVDTSLHGLQFIDCDNMTAADLAREAMMLFSASEAGKAVLEDIRMFGGIDNTVETTLVLASGLNSTQYDGGLSRSSHCVVAAGRSLRMLSNLTSCESNQAYLKTRMDKRLLTAMARLLKFLNRAMMATEGCQRDDLVKCLLDVLYTAQNMTNYDELMSNSLAQQEEFLDILLSFALELRSKVLFRESHWECIHFMALHVLVNMVESSTLVRSQIMKIPGSQIQRQSSVNASMTSTLTAIVELCIREDAAADKYLPDSQSDEESNSQDFLGSQPTPAVMSVSTINEESEGHLIERSGRNMKHSVTTAYATLLMGFLIQDNKENQEIVLSLLPEGGMKKLVSTTRKFYHLASIAGVLDQRAEKSIISIIQLLSEVAERKMLNEIDSMTK
ncbi:wings apart-like protein homolog [Corticium candelabrum]|uniref:wings apart-like protein homolog n=1 Tax=Corticium candelabrum TaxID=121492 RepID=UPI002E263702|nr:wings apart-like protein homolog [Corticium candelabrum]